MKALIIVTTVLFSTLSFDAMSQEIVLIKLQEGLTSAGGAWKSKMIVIKPDNSSESIDLDRIKPDMDGTVANMVAVKKQIEAWTSKGFKLEKMTITGESIKTYLVVMMK